MVGPVKGVAHSGRCKHDEFHYSAASDLNFGEPDGVNFLVHFVLGWLAGSLFGITEVNPRQGGIQMKIQTPRVALARAALLALAVMPTVAAAQEVSDLKSNGNLHLRGYGSFFIQGNTHTIDSATAVEEDSRASLSQAAFR